MNYQEFINEYGDVEVTFSSYYKYSFYLTAALPNGESLCVVYGGNADDIYREEFSVNEKYKVRDLEPYSGIVRDKDGNKICDFHQL